MADNPMGEPQVAALIGKAVAFAPGFAGAVLSLAFLEKLTIRGRVVAVMVGLASAMFMAPGIVDFIDLAWPGQIPATFARMIQFLVSISAMGFLPQLLGWLKKIAGDPLSLLKVRFGPSAGEVA